MDISIYKIQNKINGKSYIGQTANIIQRCNSYKNHSNKKLSISKDITKYGWENFSFEELIKVPDEIADEMEMLFQIQFNSYSPNGYNLLIGGQKLRHHSDETKKKISLNSCSRRPEIRMIKSIKMSGAGNPFYGRRHTEESKKRMSINSSSKRPEVKKLISQKMNIRISNCQFNHSKFTKEQILEMRKLYSDGSYNKIELCQLFNISKSQIWKIITNKAWKGI